MSTADYPVEFLKGTLDIAVMKIISVSPNHGYGVTLKLKELSGGVVSLSAGAVYPVLHRLERKGLVEVRWEISPTRRRTKVYSCTPAGTDWLVHRTDQWSLFNKAVRFILEEPRSARCTPGILA